MTFEEWKGRLSTFANASAAKKSLGRAAMSKADKVKAQAEIARYWAADAQGGAKKAERPAKKAEKNPEKAARKAERTAAKSATKGRRTEAKADKAAPTTTVAKAPVRRAKQLAVDPLAGLQAKYAGEERRRREIVGETIETVRGLNAAAEGLRTIEGLGGDGAEAVREGLISAASQLTLHLESLTKEVRALGLGAAATPELPATTQSTLDREIGKLPEAQPVAAKDIAVDPAAQQVFNSSADAVNGAHRAVS